MKDSHDKRRKWFNAMSDKLYKYDSELDNLTKRKETLLIVAQTLKFLEGESCVSVHVNNTNPINLTGKRKIKFEKLIQKEFDVQCKELEEAILKSPYIMRPVEKNLNIDEPNEEGE